MKTHVLTALSALSVLWLTAQGVPTYKNQKLTSDERARDLIGRMTTGEKPRQSLCPTGYGVNCTWFGYSDLQITQRMGIHNFEVKCTVTNTGTKDGEQVVQLYVRDLYASAVCAAMQLRGFERIALRPGESRRVTFCLGAKELGVWHPEFGLQVEPGDFSVMVGPSSNDIRLKGRLTVVKSNFPVEEENLTIID